MKDRGCTDSVIDRMKKEFLYGEVLWASTKRFIYVFQYRETWGTVIRSIPGSVIQWKNKAASGDTDLRGVDWTVSARSCFSTDLVKRFDPGTDWLRNIYEEQLNTV